MNILVTGCNKGLGLEMVKQLLARDETSHVYGLCRKSSPALDELKNGSSNKLTILDQMNVFKDGVIPQLQNFFQNNKDKQPLPPIDLLIHNAGASGPPEHWDTDAAFFESQSLSNITMDRMRFTFELNTLGPLRVTQALLPNLRAAASTTNKAKVIIITSAAGSITNVQQTHSGGGGGLYSYRTSKAAVKTWWDKTWPKTSKARALPWD